MLLKNFSSESKNVITITSHKVALLSDNIFVYDGWSIPSNRNILSNFPKGTVKQLEVIQELVLFQKYLSWMT